MSDLAPKGLTELENAELERLERLDEALPEAPLTDVERRLLAELRRVISQTMQPWAQQCDAWYTIRRERLYREFDKSFGAFAEREWGVPKSVAYRNADHGELLATLYKRNPKAWLFQAMKKYSPTKMLENGHSRQRECRHDLVIPMPQEEPYGNALAKLPKSEKEEAWQEAVALADAGKPTVKQVREVVARRLRADAPSPLPFAPEDMESSPNPEVSSGFAQSAGPTGRMVSLSGVGAPPETLEERYHRAALRVREEGMTRTFTLAELVLDDRAERYERALARLLAEAEEAEKTGGPTPLMDRVLAAVTT